MAKTTAEKRQKRRRDADDTAAKAMRTKNATTPQISKSKSSSKRRKENTLNTSLSGQKSGQKNSNATKEKQSITAATSGKNIITTTSENSSKSSKTSTRKENTLYLVVEQPSASTCPVVVSFPSGVPNAMIEAEQTYDAKNGRAKVSFEVTSSSSNNESDDESSSSSSSNDSDSQSSSTSGSDSDSDDSSKEDVEMNDVSDGATDKRTSASNEHDDSSTDQAYTNDDDIPTFKSGYPLRLSSSRTPGKSGSPLLKKSQTSRVIRGLDSTNTYTSHAAGSLQDGRKTKLYVGLYHKETGKLVLHETSERGSIHALSQTVSNYQPTVGEGGVSLETRNLTPMQRRQLLFESFGSSKKQRALRSQQANIVDMKSVVGAGKSMMKNIETSFKESSESNIKAMEKVKKLKKEEEEAEKNANGDNYDVKKLPETKVSSAVDEAYNMARRKFLPPFDESADEAFKVYDAQEIAGEEAWGSISRFSDYNIHQYPSTWKTEIVKVKSNEDENIDQEMEEENKETNKKYPKKPLLWFDSTKQLLATLPDDVSSRGSKTALKTVILLNHLLNFHKHVSSSRKIVTGTAYHLSRQWSMPLPIVETFLSLFCSSTSARKGEAYTTTKQLDDKRLVHIFILYLLAHGNEMKVGNINNLCDDLQITTRIAQNYYRQAGCTCSKKNGEAVSVSLKVPLTFPPPPRRKSRG